MCGLAALTIEIEKYYVYNIFIINFKWYVVIGYLLVGKRVNFNVEFKLELVKTYL